MITTVELRNDTILRKEWKLGENYMKDKIRYTLLGWFEEKNGEWILYNTYDYWDDEENIICESTTILITKPTKNDIICEAIKQFSVDYVDHIPASEVLSKLDAQEIEEAFKGIEEGLLDKPIKFKSKKGAGKPFISREEGGKLRRNRSK